MPSPPDGRAPHEAEISQDAEAARGDLRAARVGRRLPRKRLRSSSPPMPELTGARASARNDRGQLGALRRLARLERARSGEAALSAPPHVGCR